MRQKHMSLHNMLTTVTESLPSVFLPTPSADTTTLLVHDTTSTDVRVDTTSKNDANAPTITAVNDGDVDTVDMDNERARLMTSSC